MGHCQREKSSDEFNAIASLTEAVSDLATKLEQMDSKLESTTSFITTNLAQEVLKIIAEQQNIKTGRNFSSVDESQERVQVSFKSTPDLASELNSRIEELKQSGQKITRNKFISDAIREKLDSPDNG